MHQLLHPQLFQRNSLQNLSVVNLFSTFYYIIFISVEISTHTHTYNLWLQMLLLLYFNFLELNFVNKIEIVIKTLYCSQVNMKIILYGYTISTFLR